MFEERHNAGDSDYDLSLHSELQPSETSGLSQQLKNQVFWQHLDRQSSAMIYSKLPRTRE